MTCRNFSTFAGFHIQREIDIQRHPFDSVKNRRNASADDEFHLCVRKCEENFVNVVAHSIVL